jgi:S-adenosylmethionine synthetase
MCKSWRGREREREKNLNNKAELKIYLTTTATEQKYNHCAVIGRNERANAFL